jgi:hypothetical protein
MVLRGREIVAIYALLIGLVLFFGIFGLGLLMRGITDSEGVQAVLDVLFGVGGIGCASVLAWLVGRGLAHRRHVARFGDSAVGTSSLDNEHRRKWTLRAWNEESARAFVQVRFVSGILICIATGFGAWAAAASSDWFAAGFLGVFFTLGASVLFLAAREGRRRKSSGVPRD